MFGKNSIRGVLIFCLLIIEICFAFPPMLLSQECEGLPNHQEIESSIFTNHVLSEEFFEKYREELFIIIDILAQTAGNACEKGYKKFILSERFLGSNLTLLKNNEAFIPVIAGYLEENNRRWYRLGYYDQNYALFLRFKILEENIKDTSLLNDFKQYPHLLYILFVPGARVYFLERFFKEVYPFMRKEIRENAHEISTIIFLSYGDTVDWFFKGAFKKEARKAFSQRPKEFAELYRDCLQKASYECPATVEIAFPSIEKDFLKYGYKDKVKEIWLAIISLHIVEENQNAMDIVRAFFESHMDDIKENPRLFQVLGSSIICKRWERNCPDGTNEAYKKFKSYGWKRKDEIIARLESIRDDKDESRREAKSAVIRNTFDDFFTYFGEEFDKDGFSPRLTTYWESMYKIYTTSGSFDSHRFTAVIDEFKDAPGVFVEMCTDAGNACHLLMERDYFNPIREEYHEYGYSGIFKEQWRAFTELAKAEFDKKDFPNIAPWFKKDPKIFIKVTQKINEKSKILFRTFDIFESWLRGSKEEFWHFILNASNEFFDADIFRLLVAHRQRLDRKEFRALLTKLSQEKDAIKEKAKLLFYLYDMNYPDDRIAIMVFQVFPKYKGNEPVFRFEQFERAFKEDLLSLLFYRYFGRDFRRTDSKIFGIDTNNYGFSIERGISLRRFDYRNIDGYTRLFSMIREIFPEREEEALQAIDFSSVAADLGNKTTAEKVRIITEFENSVSIDIGKMLFRVLFPDIDNAVLKITQGYYNPKTNMIDVTQHNFSDIMSLVSLLEKAISYETPFTKTDALLGIFHENDKMELDSGEKVLLYVISKLDVEEVNFKELRGISAASFVMNLMNIAEKYQNEEALRYLKNKFDTIDFVSLVFDEEKGNVSLASIYFDLKAVDNIRRVVNRSVDRISGDRIVIQVGTRFLRQKITATNLKDFLRFAETWKEAKDLQSSELSYYYRDTLGLYQLIGNYAYNKIIRFLQEKRKELGEKSLINELETGGISYNELIVELDHKGYSIIENNGVLQKAVSRAPSNPLYVVRKGTQDIFGNGTSVNNKEAKELSVHDAPWNTHSGVSVRSIKLQEKEIARMIKCKRENVGISMLMNSEGKVNMKKAEEELHGSIIFAAPVSMTTENHKLKEFGVQNGIVYSWLISFYGRDAFIISDYRGDVMILNKRDLMLSKLVPSNELSDYMDFYERRTGRKIDESTDVHLKLMDYPEDFVFLIDVLKERKLSLVSEMFLIEEGVIQNLARDDDDFRRLFVEYEDGDIGILNSSVIMTTESMLHIAKAVGAKNAVYMDTGMYDMATYYEPNGIRHIMGHEDTDESTNRILLYRRSIK